MKKLVSIPAVAFLLAATFLWTPSAEAATDWVFGAAFEIGGVHFNIGLRGHDRGGPDYYYRTPVDLGRSYYGRTHRSDSCYRSGRHHYHAASCPLIRDYFSRHGYSTSQVFYNYAPGYGGYGNDRYDRHDRHRPYRHRGHRGHYDRHDRYDRHYGHGSSCRRY